MSEPSANKSGSSGPSLFTRFPILKQTSDCAAVAVVVFLIGFVPMWFKARARAQQRDAAQSELRISQLQNALASAAIDARRGEYEAARQTASTFYTLLRDEMDRGKESALTETTHEAQRGMLTGRDEMITWLARSDPASAERLANVHVAFRKAVHP